MACTASYELIKFIDFDDTEPLLINVYLPTDYGSSDSYSEYLLTLGELEGFQSFDNLAVIGDFNADFARDNAVLRLLKSFMEDTGLIATDLAFRDTISFTYERDDSSATSWVCEDTAPRGLLGPYLSVMESEVSPSFMARLAPTEPGLICTTRC